MFDCIRTILADNKITHTYANMFEKKLQNKDKKSYIIALGSGALPMRNTNVKPDALFFFVLYCVSKYLEKISASTKGT
jgi:hypothetical protein